LQTAPLADSSPGDSNESSHQESAAKRIRVKQRRVCKYMHRAGRRANCDAEDGRQHGPAIRDPEPARRVRADRRGFAILAPAGTPREIVARLNTEILRAIGDAEVRRKLEELGFAVRGSSADELRVMTRDQLAKYARVIKEVGIANE
jgi:hypothetical protein